MRLLGIVSISLLGLEGALWHIDPLGIRIYFYGQIDQQRIMLAAAHGYNLQAGRHTFGNFTVTIDERGNRVVPDSGDSDCIIGLLGDSITFGWGVADEATFASQLAREYPRIRWVNLARSGYSAPNIAQVQAEFRAAGYLWLIIDNDAAPRWEYSGSVPPRSPTAVELYIRYGVGKPAPGDHDFVQYWTALEQITRYPVLLVGFEDDALALMTAQRYPVMLIPPYTHFVSAYDRHPNAQGHRQIALSLLPHLAGFVERACHA